MGMRRGERLAAETASKSRNCAIKNITTSSGRIYHVPGARHYGRTRIDEGEGERWFCTPEEAERAGWRAPRG